MKIKNIIWAFMVSLASLALSQKGPDFLGQDPIMEEGVKCWGKHAAAASLGEQEDYWDEWVKLEMIAQQATNPRSKAYLKWLKIGTPRPFETEGAYEWYKKKFCPHLLGSQVPPELRFKDEKYKSDKDLRCLFYDPFYLPYMKAVGRYEEALQRLKNGTLRELYEELRNAIEEERDKIYKELEEYDPDLSIACLYYPDTDRAYYIIDFKKFEEYSEWEKSVYKHETLQRISHLKDKLSPKEFEKVLNETRSKVEREKIKLVPAFLIEQLAYWYAKKGEYDKAIMYWEMYWGDEERMHPMYIGTGNESGHPLEWRKSYLEQLRKMGEVDKLCPFLYINDKPFNPKKGFTKGGKPFVSTHSLLKALNISFEWTREGKLLTIKKDDGTMKIANIKDKWWIYNDGERREVEAYIKDKELYLPLKELCELLNLKLEWDEDTFIGKVSTK